MNFIKSPRCILRGIFSGLFLLVAVLAAAQPVSFVIAHTSDMHGHIAATPDPLSTETKRPMVGGFAVLKTFADEVRHDAVLSGAMPLLLDCGDWFEGTPIVDETRGSCMVDMMNRMHYTTALIGNHDFDYGTERLNEMLAKFTFPLLCCNAIRASDGKALDHLRPYLMVPFKGKKLAIIGIITPLVDKLAFEENIRGVLFKEPLPILNKLIPEVRKKGADFVIILSHLGIEDDRRLGEKLHGADLILGGHSHTTMTQIEYIGPDRIPCIHSGSELRNASKIKITIESGKAAQITFEPIVLFASKYPEDATIKKIIDSYIDSIKEKTRELLGFSQVELNRGIIGGDSSLGAFVADAMKDAAGADFAFVNIGGIRYPINKGPITYEDIFLLQPFANTVDILMMTGKQIVDLIEKSLSVPFAPVSKEDLAFAKENFKLYAEGLRRDFHGDFGYLIPANLLITFDPELPAFKRITKITDASGHSIDPEKTYSVALNNFMSLGGDGYSYLRTFKPRQATKMLVRDALIGKLRQMKIIKTVPIKRMNNLKLTVRPYDQ
ncbi:MAG: bifunctional metallophosphatase/5'-nucleotidase [Candidatus Riflebacteria bacterium]|nr:bifunctional metallophosphatase/5'-nucleotidase [Candidatus Riflebacteria bacterium]